MAQGLPDYRPITSFVAVGSDPNWTCVQPPTQPAHHSIFASSLFGMGRNSLLTLCSSVRLSGVFLSWPDHREALARSRGQGWAPGQPQSGANSSLTAASTAPGSVRPGESRRDRHAPTPTCCDWRHRGQSPAALHARVPRARCDKCGVKKISVPWARDGGGLTLLFEALVRALVSAMPGNAVPFCPRRTEFVRRGL